jgi:periplasmic protein TonB
MKKLQIWLVIFLSISAVNIQAQVSDNLEEVLTVVEKMPEFPGGENALIEFLKKQIKYPEDAKDLGISGTVYTSFVVGTDGKLKESKIIKGVHPILDEEALRVLEKMPAWKPGKQKGKPVNVSYVLPIKFTLTDPKN